MHSPSPSSPPSPDAPQDPALSDLVMQTAHLLRARWRERLAPWDLSPHQGRALGTIAQAGRLRLSDLAGALRIAPRSVTEVVDGLVERGLVRRVPDPADRRATLVELTPEGQQVNDEVRSARGGDAAALFARLSSSDADELARILRGVLAAGQDGDVPGGPPSA